ncbi:hypothetical protein PHMEG_00027759 [Phytophthora megakarya]|uniref:Uncharacterized protein n=1 Tax=Phytophthora megakarya TaxID=4795 RepID=A0A225V866_9STRA|nr:hypothetical protein PHMEG_00027759 [Phytophthora megakarya]
MDAWASVARKLKGLEDFTKAELTGKSAQARFNVLIDQEKTGKYIRDEAVSRLKKRKEQPDETYAETSQPHKVTVLDIMREDNEKERVLRVTQWEQEQEMMRQQKEAELNDRKEEREFRLHLARLENEKFKTLLQLAKLKSGGEITSMDCDNDDGTAAKSRHP